ncbi:hypothetical protein [Actinophytocola sp. KF-1]
MIEDRLADRMRAALTDEPPLGFDPDELADRAGALRRRRRAAVAVAGVAAAVLAVAVAAVVATAGGRGPETGSPPPTTAPGTVCRGVEEGAVPPLNFPGSAAVVDRLDAAAPAAIAEHLPGVTVRPSETGMIAYDCPPNVGTVYPVNGADQSVMVYVVHAEDTLDLANDRYAEDRDYRLLDEGTATDGARIRAYQYRGPGSGAVLVVVRFGPDGTVTEASVSGQGPLVADRAALTALASDPELRF